MEKAFWKDDSPTFSQREKRKQEFRDKIVFAAIDLFEKNGCEETTIEDICELAEVSRPTFYSYYSSKSDLTHALAERLWLRVASRFTEESLADKSSTKAFLRSFFSMIQNDVSKYSRLERELIKQSMSGGSTTSDTENGSMDILHGLTALLKSIYQKGQLRGEVADKYPLDFLAEMTMGEISTLMIRWAEDESFPIKERLELLIEYVSDVIQIR